MTQQRFCLVTFIGLLVLLLGTVSGFAQQFSLDDNPSPPGPYGPGMTPFPLLQSAEDEYGYGNHATLNGLVGPSPTLAILSLYDSVIFSPGTPNPSPVTALWPYLCVDSFSTDHNINDNPNLASYFDQVWLHFSIDRAAGGIVPGDHTYWQASINEQPGDIFQGTTAFPHPGQFVGQPCIGGGYQGVLPCAGVGGSNVQIIDHTALGLYPPSPCPPIQPGTHDNVDGYNSDLSVSDSPIYFTVPVYEALTRTNVWPGYIYVQQTLGNNTVYATTSQIGITSDDSIDALVVWDMEDPYTAQPDLDYALFSLAPGSPTLYTVWLLNNNVNAGTIFFTDFSGCFYVYAYSSDLGVGGNPLSINIPLIFKQDVYNIDALELSLEEWQ